MHFYRCEKLEFDNKRILFEDTFYLEKFDVAIVQLNCRTSSIKNLDVKSNFIIYKVSRTRTTKTFNIELIDSLSDKYLIT